MSDQHDDEPPIVDQIKADVVETIGRYFPPVKRRFKDSDGGPINDLPTKPDEDIEFDFDEFDDELGGYRLVETFGEDGVLTATTSDGRTFTIVRWQLFGSHYRPIPSPIGDATMVRATGNPVEVDGLTIVEISPAGDRTIRRYVDWLPVYAQLGIVFPGRPVGMVQTQVLDPTPLMRERRRDR